VVIQIGIEELGEITEREETLSDQLPISERRMEQFTEKETEVLLSNWMGAPG